MKLDLQLGEILQGDCALKELNLMLVFQVNCPGCLSKALPDLNRIADDFPQINAFALSTAFEEFNLNNLHNTRQLLEQGSLTQASQRYFERLGHKNLPYKINTPVVMDYFIQNQKLSELHDVVLEQIEGELLQPKVSRKIRDILDQRLLPLARSGRTFLNNELQGTPSWFIFDEHLNVLDSWFGHKDEQWVRSVIERCLDK